MCMMRADESESVSIVRVKTPQHSLLVLRPRQGLRVTRQAHGVQSVVHVHQGPGDAAGEGRAQERGGLANLFL